VIVGGELLDLFAQAASASDCGQKRKAFAATCGRAREDHVEADAAAPLPNFFASGERRAWPRPLSDRFATLVDIDDAQRQPGIKWRGLICW
jgi:hypothetical protein